ncbi:MAG TPA: SAM-dependent DNA methyltransferase [Terriglobia bacterium]|nr:SAM-dependent DNA methyltransferase [Terriglobia bacterium]
MATIAKPRIEERRQEEQVRLDLLKTAHERNKLGQFATPSELALSLARYAQTLLGNQSVRFLDPAIGTGSFFSALSQVFPQQHIQRAAGIEVDPLFAGAAHELWTARGLQVIEGDFTKKAPEPLYNLVLTNPPYVRHHHIPAPEKDRLRGRIDQSLHLNISGLAGLYCYFLLLSHDWMEERGVAIWLIPSEFMDVNYGVALRRYLTERVTLFHIHRFCPTDVQFTDALVSSAVVVFRKTPPPPGHRARFSFGGPITAPQSDALVPLDTLRNSSKWTQFPASTAVAERAELKLGDIFHIKRGLATGSNGFFILNQDQIEQWQIPGQFLKPILPGPRYITNDVIEALADGTPDVSPRLFLLDCSQPENLIESKWPRFYAYVKIGHEEKVSESYLASRRAPWYSQEQRPPAPFLCTYMGRSRDGKPPFRFIWNRSKATAHNVYLMLYPRGPLLQAMQEQMELYAQVFNALKRITPAEILAEGRVYGGGLHKLEPNELAQVPARLVLDSIGPQVQVERQGILFN